MDYGLFTMPSHPPERSLYDGHRWDLQQLRWADELGFSEAWIGEHHTAPWEPHPSPDLLVAQALLQTERMRIGPGGFLMPYHHPAELANRVAMLDHLAQGRLNFGVAASGLPSDWAMFNVDGNAGQHREMTPEARGVAPGARGLRRRHGRGGAPALCRLHDGAHDDGVLPVAPRVLPVHRVPEAPARRARLRRDARVLRAAQLARGLARDGRREAPRHLRRGRRLRHTAALLLRLLGEPEGVAPLAGAAGPRGHAEVQGARAGVLTRVVARVLLLLAALPGPAAAAPEGTLTWGLHVTLATRWLDPSDTEAFINPVRVLYAIHDALVKPMPAGDNTPSLAESWTAS